MTDAYVQQLAELCAPGLATLVHPGDDTAGIHPFPLALGMFQPAAMPEGMAREIADDMGMPTPDLNKHFLEAVIHMFAAAGAVIRPKAEYDQLVAATGLVGIGGGGVQSHTSPSKIVLPSASMRRCVIGPPCSHAPPPRTAPLADWCCSS